VDAKWLVTVAGLALIGYLVVAGTIAKDINYTSIALALVTLLGLMWGNPMNRRNGDDK
jgi:hypothetical protein